MQLISQDELAIVYSEMQRHQASPLNLVAPILKSLIPTQLCWLGPMFECSMLRLDQGLQILAE
jgi:hypothetical protein